MSTEPAPLIATECCLYQEASVVERHIQSLKLGELIDYAIFIDGPFPGFPGSYESNDGTREIIKSYDKTVLVTMPAEEYFKRELACHISRSLGCRFILIIDADEYLIRRNVERFRGNLEKVINSGTDRNIFGINYNFGAPDQFYDRPRLWYKPWEVGYIGGSHWRFKNLYHSKYYDPTIQIDRWDSVVEGIVIREDSTQRPTYREKLGIEYQNKIIIPRENEFETREDSI
jgi:hypothetical protein